MVRAGNGAARLVWGASVRVNERGQPIGDPVTGWQPPPPPVREAMVGRWCEIVPLGVDEHAPGLWASYAEDAEGAGWTYLTSGPFDGPEAFRAWVANAASSQDPLFYAIVDRARGVAAGVAAYLRISPAAGSIEVGHIHLSPSLARTAAATEAMYLLLRHAFALGYRRYEWKCDALNAPSRAAAERLGFRFEGVFRKAMIYRGRNRDTAWYAITDDDWPDVRQALERWLSPENFDPAGRQRRRLADLRNAGDAGREGDGR